MESGNSSSMQSSAGGGNGAAGDDDFDSRPDSSSSLPFFSSSSSQPNHLPFNHNPNPCQQQQQQQQDPPPLSALFDHPSADFPSYDTSSMLNPDNLLWSNNPQQFVGVLMSSSTQQQHHPDRDRDDAAAALMGAAGTAAGSTEGGDVQTRPKKRTRASRRAPTTVLATDTSNFRAMVQQYTGIPSSPYSAVSSSSSPFSRRLDLIRSPFTGRGGGGGAVGNLFRPAAQNQTAAAGVSSSGAGAGSIFSFGNTIGGENMGRRDCTDVDGINIFANFNSSNNSFQSLRNSNPMAAAAFPRMPLGFDGLPQMTFQSLLSSPFSSMTYPSMVSSTEAAVTAGGSDVFGAQFNDQGIGVNNNSDIRVEDDGLVGVSHDHVGGFSGVGIGSDGTGPKNDKHDHRHNDNGGGNDGLATDEGNYVVNCGSSSSTTNLQRDQLLENTVTANSRGEGTLASWINSPS